jgi:hypothetical protein
MLYKVRPGQSPALIARQFGIPMSRLIHANPHKPTKMVGGRLTWKEIRHNETLNVPTGGTVGDAVTDAINALIAAGSPCNQANVAFVCAVQRALGVTVDGKWGTGTSTAARAFVPNAPAGCSPTPSWWGAKGTSKCPSVSAPSPTPVPTSTSIPTAVQAIASIDPCYSGNVSMVCAAQAALGLTVDGKYGTNTAAAVRRLVPGAPPGCSPTPSWWGAKGTSKCGGDVSPTPAPPPPPQAPPPVTTRTTMPVQSSIPAAVQALAAIDPCRQENVSIVVAAQRALGFSASASDGKYGSDTATAARRLLPNAPAGCSPRPAWWTPPGQSNASSGAAQAAAAAKTAADAAQAAAAAAQGAQTAGQAAAAADTAAAAAAAAATAAQNAAPDQKPAADAAAATAAQAANTAAQAATGGGGAITPPVATKLSTGAIVAGAVGVAALVGVAAMAMSGKKTGHRRSSGGSAKRKSSHGKRKTAKKKRK